VNVLYITATTQHNSMTGSVTGGTDLRNIRYTLEQTVIHKYVWSNSPNISYDM